MWGHWDGYSWGMMGLGMIGMSLLWILPIVVIVLLVKVLWGSDSGVGRTREKKPLDILKERYARGEIDKEEFEQKKHDLGD